MRESVTQKSEYGCGVACFAFVLGLDYRAAAGILGEVQSSSERFWVKDLIAALRANGLNYRSEHIKIAPTKIIYQEGAIVLLRRSRRYPAGHYLVRHSNAWMDPWINMVGDGRISHATSGFRKRLPGVAMYVLSPIDDNT